MKTNSRIRFNPTTNEVEIEGSESFVKTYFNKIQDMMSGSRAGSVKVSRARVRTARRVKKEAKAEALPVKVVKRAVKARKKTGAEKTTLFDKVVRLVQVSEGMTTAELKEKTGLTEKQIWSIIYRAEKLGKIKKSKRGVYEPAG